MIKIVYPACWNLIIRCANDEWNWMFPSREYARLMK